MNKKENNNKKNVPYTFVLFLNIHWNRYKNPILMKNRLHLRKIKLKYEINLIY